MAESTNSTSNFEQTTQDEKASCRMTPRMMIIVGIILAVLSFAADMAAAIGLRHMSFTNPDIANAVTFGVYIVPLVLAFLSVLALFIGAWRWAAYGARAAVPPRRMDAGELSRKLDLIIHGVM